MTAHPLSGAAPGALAREKKLLPAPVTAVGEGGVFEGYASLFGVPDLGKDVVSPGAFADSLARRGVGGIRLLFQHDPAAPLGRWLSIVEDSRGLRVRGKLNLAVARAREVHALLREGAIDGLSIGFRVERARHERSTGLRRLEKLDLWEISIVTFPMLPGARVSGIKRDKRETPENPLSRPSLREGHPLPPGERDLAAVIRRAARRLFPSSPKRFS